MSVTLVNPAELPGNDSYHQVSVATGTRTVHIAGQVAWNADGDTVGTGDLAAQVEQCYRNVAAALAEVGADLDDLVKLTVYIVDWTPDKLPQFLAGVDRAAAALGSRPTAPGTLLGVAELHIPEHLVEVEAVAILD